MQCKFSCLLSIRAYPCLIFQLFLILVVTVNIVHNPFCIFYLDQQHPIRLEKQKLQMSVELRISSSPFLSSCTPCGLDYSTNGAIVNAWPYSQAERQDKFLSILLILLLFGGIGYKSLDMGYEFSCPMRLTGTLFTCRFCLLSQSFLIVSQNDCRSGLFCTPQIFLWVNNQIRKCFILKHFMQNEFLCKRGWFNSDVTNQNELLFLSQNNILEFRQIQKTKNSGQYRVSITEFNDVEVKLFRLY